MQNSVQVTHYDHYTQVECTCGWSMKALPQDSIGSDIVAHQDTHNQVDCSIMTLTELEYNKRVEANPESVFYRYTTREDALASFTRKDANPLFNSDELFMFYVDGCGWVVQTTGSFQKAGSK